MTIKNQIVSKTRNITATKEAILLSAQEEFASAPFQNVNVRSIAKRAKIDAALVSRYYGSKKYLFEVALNKAHEEAKLLEGVGREDLASVLVPRHEADNEPHKLRLLLIGTYSMTDPEVRDILQKSSMKFFIKPLIKIIGGPQAKYKALLITSVLMGFIMSSRFIFTEQFVDTYPKNLLALQDMIQTILDAPE